MSKFCCITDLIRFMMKEADKLMKGSLHEDDFFILHDSLLLIIVKETITCIKENNYSHRWFLPMNGLQDGTPYAGRPLGNSPKFMPLDNSLNKDIFHSFRFCCFLSHFVLDGEGTDEEERIMQFSFSAPKEIARVLMRIWESKMGTTSSARIIEYVDLEFKLLEVV